MKNFKTIYSFAFLFAAILFMSSCHKDKPQTDLGSGPITLHFDSRAGADEFAFGTNYVTANGDTVNFSKFNFYVSNVVFIKADGSTYTPPKDSTYRLIVESIEESHDLTINNVPGGDYTGVKFLIGVDSLKSVSDISQRTGDLDPAGAASDMYWTWNSGYIFYKIEGTSPQAPYDSMMGMSMFYYHIGGFGGYSSPTINNLRTVMLSYAGEAAHAGKGKAPEFHIYADALQVWKSPTPFTIASQPGVMFDPFSTTISTNYKDMFSINHIHND
jgi:hypothetical protein